MAIVLEPMKNTECDFLKVWTDKLFKTFYSSDLYFQEVKKIKDKNSLEILFLDTIPHDQVNLWNRGYYIYHPLENSLCQQTKGSEKPCNKDISLTLFKPVFPQIISPWNLFSHVTITNILRNQGSSDRTVGSADLKVVCLFFSFPWIV